MIYLNENDPLLEGLRDLRQDPPPDLVSPTGSRGAAILDHVLAGTSQTSTGRTSGREATPAAGHRVVWRCAAAVAAVLLVLVVANEPRGRSGGSDSAKPTLDVQTIAAVTADRLSTGRATIAFTSDVGAASERRVTGQVSFAGEDLEMRLHFSSPDDPGGFDAANRTVDGEFYLLDGPPGDLHWFHDTTASGARGSDLFNADPRQLLQLLSATSDFKTLETVDGVTRLAASRPDELSQMRLALGPVETTDLRRLEVWVGADHVVQRLHLDLEHELPDPSDRGDDPARASTTSHDPSSSISRTSYTVEFTDSGAPVHITAPLDATPIAGEG